MATVATLNVRITANATELTAALSTVQNRGALMMRGVGNAVSAVNGQVVNFVQDSLRVGGAFQESMNQVAAVSRDSLAEYDAAAGRAGAGMEALSNLAQQMGIETQFSATQASEGLNFLALAGFDVNEQLSALPNVLNLAAAGQMDLGRASDIATDTLTGFGLSVEDLPRVVDVMAATFTKTNTDLNQLGRGMTYVGPIASQLGLSFEETAAGLGNLANAGFKATMGGTALRGALSRMVNPTGAAGSAMKQLGIDVIGADGEFVGLIEAVRQFESASDGSTAVIRDVSQNFDNLSQTSMMTQNALIDMGLATGKAGQESFALANGITNAEQLITRMGGSSQFVADLMTIFGQRAGPGMAALIAQGSDSLVSLTSELQNAGGTASAVADTQMQGLNGALKELRSAWEGLQIAVFEGDIGAVIEQHVDRLAEFVRNLASNEELISSVLTGLSQAISVAADVFMRLLNAGERVLTWFSGLPKPIQNSTVVITALTMAVGPAVLGIAQFVATIATLAAPIGAAATATTAATAGIGGVTAAAGAGTAALGALKAAFAVLTGPIGIAAAAIAGVVIAWKKDFLGFRTWVQGWFPELASWFATAGENLIMGLVNGIKNVASRAFEAVKSVGEGIKNTFQQLFDFGSPSKVTTQWGAWIGQGTANGIARQLGNVRRQSQRLAMAAMPQGSVSGSSTSPSVSTGSPPSGVSNNNRTTNMGGVSISINGGNADKKQLADEIMNRLAQQQRRAEKGLV